MAKAVTDEMRKKAWDYGSKSKDHYNVLTSEQKKAFWEYGKNNNLYDVNKLDDFKKSEFNTYVNTPKPTIKKLNLDTARPSVQSGGRPMINFDAKKLDKASGTAGAFTANLVDSATLGLATKALDKIDKGAGTKALADASKGHGVASTLGGLTGYTVPFGAAGKIAKPLTKSITNKLLKTAATGAIEGAIVGSAEGGIKGKNVVKSAGEMAALGVGGNLAIAGAGKLIGKVLKPRVFEPKMETPMVEAPKIEPNKPIKKIQLAGTKFKVNNPQYEKAVTKYNDAIETIQNHFQTNKLIPEEIARIKTELGIDLDALVNNVAKYENKLNLKEIGIRQNQKYVAGVQDKIKPTLQRSNEIADKRLLVSQANTPIDAPATSMTAQEFDKLYGLDEHPTKSNINKLVEDVGKTVIRKTGTSDIPTIVNHYVEKYKLPNDVKVTFNARKEITKGSTVPIRDANGNVIGARININPNQSLESRIGSLRHEIEHYKDLTNGYTPSTSKYKFNPKTDTTGRALYENASKGHHQNFNWFESDYLRQNLTDDVANNVVNSVPIAQGSQVLAPTGKTVESGFSKNVRTDLNMNNEVRKSFADNPIEHDILSNTTTLKSATDRYNQGYDVALKQFRENSELRPDDIPLARMLANESAKRGDIATAREIIAKTAEKLTDAGRVAQAARILRRSDPSVFVGYLEKQVTKINEEGLKRYGNKWTEVKIPDSEIKEIYKLEIYDEAAMKKAMERTYKTISEQMPSTNMEKFNAWRRMAMLLNPLTHIRNVVGNSLFVPLRKSADAVASAFEKSLPIEKRTKSVGWSHDKNLKSIVEEDWSKYGKEIAENNGRWELPQVLGREKRIFKNNTLEKINKFSGKSLESEDIPFLKNAYSDALGGYMKAQKLTQVTQEARDYASRRALEATYKDLNKFSTLITSIKNKSGIFGEAILPFAKTPSNLTVRAFEYSPYGLITELGKAANQARKGTFEATKFIEQMSKGITGTVGLTGLGFALAHAGILTGSASTDKDQAAFDVENGKQPYSITIGGKNFTYDFAQPVAVPLAMGAEIYNKIKNNTGAVDVAYSSMIAGGDTIFNSSMLKNIKAVFGGSYSSPTEAIAGTLMNYPKQAVPTLGGQLARIIDPNNRDISGNSTTDVLKNYLLSRTPGASQTLPKKINTRGEESTSGNIGERLLKNMLSPSSIKSVSSNPVDKMIDSVYKETGDKAIFPKVAPKYFTENSIKYILTPQEKNDFQKTMGEYTYKFLERLTDSSSSGKTKAKIINKTIEKAYEKAKMEYLRKHKEMK